MIAPQPKIVSITVNARGAVFGLGEDNKMYVWVKYRGIFAPRRAFWRLYI